MSDTEIRVDWQHKRACERAARLLRELDGIGDGMSLDGQSAMLIADFLDEIGDRITRSYRAEEARRQERVRPFWMQRRGA